MAHRQIQRAKLRTVVEKVIWLVALRDIFGGLRELKIKRIGSCTAQTPKALGRNEKPVRGSMRKLLPVALLALLPAGFVVPAQAQDVTRVCVQSIGATGSNNCVDVSTSNPLPVTGSVSSAPATGTKAEGVASITTGGTAQQVISAVQNTNGYLLYVSPGFSNTDPIYCSDTQTTTTAESTGALPLNPSTATTTGGSFSSPPVWWAPGHAVWCVGATTGDKVGWHVN